MKRKENFSNYFKVHVSLGTFLTLRKVHIKSFLNSTLHPKISIPFFASKKIKLMNQKIIYIVSTIIAISVLFVLFRPIKNTTQNEETKTETTYSTGKTEQLYKKGKDSITTKTKSIHNKIILHLSAADSTYKYSIADSSCNLSLNIQPASDGNLSMDYFLNLTSKELVRIDTIYQLRVDTLKIKQTISERIDPPFYNTFLFGAVITGTVILLLTILIR